MITCPCKKYFEVWYSYSATFGDYAQAWLTIVYSISISETICRCELALYKLVRLRSTIVSAVLSMFQQFESHLSNRMANHL